MKTNKQESHAHCRCMNLGGQCPNRHFADCDICKPNGLELQVQRDKAESHEGVEELIAAADSHMRKAMPILDKSERASMLNWLREKLTPLVAQNTDNPPTGFNWDKFDMDKFFKEADEVGRIRAGVAQKEQNDHCTECWKHIGQSGDVPIYGCVNAACKNCHIQLVKEQKEGVVERVLKMTVENQRVYDTLNEEQKECFHINIRNAVEEAVIQHTPTPTVKEETSYSKYVYEELYAHHFYGDIETGEGCMYLCKIGTGAKDDQDGERVASYVNYLADIIATEVGYDRFEKWRNKNPLKITAYQFDIPPPTVKEESTQGWEERFDEQFVPKENQGGLVGALAGPMREYAEELRAFIKEVLQQQKDAIITEYENKYRK